MRWSVAMVMGLWAVNANAACEIASGVRINELMPWPEASESEWVELYNGGPLTAELEGWVVEGATQANRWSEVFVIPAGVSLAPGQRVVVGDLGLQIAGAWVINVEAEGTFGNNSRDFDDGARLVDCMGSPVDVLVYGAGVEGEPFLDEEGEAVIGDKLAPLAEQGESLSRVPDGVDTNNGALDFQLVPPTPGLINESDPGGPARSCEQVSARGQVVINEVLPAPGALSNPEGDDSGWEWLELYNPGGQPVELGGWTVEQAGAPDDWGTRIRFVIPAGTILPAGAWLLISDPLATFGEIEPLRLDDGSLGLGNSQDGVRLLGCDGTIVDQLIYGGSNPDGFLDLDGAVLADESVAPAVKDDRALARRADGYQEGDDADDFVLTDPTPGAANADLTCKSSMADGALIRINELFPNPDGTDSQAESEWVELYNAGGQTFDLSTWSIVRASSMDEGGQLTTTVMYSFGPGVDIGPGQYFVVAALQAEVGDRFTEDLDFPSGTNGDVVFLQSCRGERVDGLVYGGVNEDLIPEDNGDVPANVAPYPSEGACIARRQDGVDSNQSIRDFSLTRYCTPKASNQGNLGDDGDGTDGPDGGCGGARRAPRAVGARQVGQGCETAPSWPGWVALWALAARRRPRRS